MIEAIAIIVGVLISYGIGFVVGCYLTLNSIRQDGIDLFFDGNAWKIKEQNEKNS